LKISCASFLKSSIVWYFPCDSFVRMVPKSIGCAISSRYLHFVLQQRYFQIKIFLRRAPVEYRVDWSGEDHGMFRSQYRLENLLAFLLVNGCRLSHN
jgi:hypothetical protein